LFTVLLVIVVHDVGPPPPPPPPPIGDGYGNMMCTKKKVVAYSAKLGQL
jgi:hypothetical protein